MSKINTNGLNVNYPLPGVNNSSQGFRDNFNTIKTNLDTANVEISDLQSKVIVKSPLNGITLNNDMANTLISNAAVRSFRSTTYNLGANVSGLITINTSLGDVHYGTVVGNTTLNFANWGPTGTQCNVQLLLTIANSAATINFPTTTYNASSIVTAGMRESVKTIENWSSNAAPAPSTVVTNSVTTPNGVTALHWNITSVDCGVTLDIEAVNRPRSTNQIVSSSVPTLGNATATGTITTSTASTTVTGVGTTFLAELVAGSILMDTANVAIGTVQSIASDTSLTLSVNALQTLAGVNFNVQNAPIGQQGDVPGTMFINANYIYVCTKTYDATSIIWKRLSLSPF